MEAARITSPKVGDRIYSVWCDSMLVAEVTSLTEKSVMVKGLTNGYIPKRLDRPDRRWGDERGVVAVSSGCTWHLSGEAAWQAEIAEAEAAITHKKQRITKLCEKREQWRAANHHSASEKGIGSDARTSLANADSSQNPKAREKS